MIQFRKATTNDVPELLKLEQSLIEAERPFNSSLKSEKAYYYDLDFLVADKDTYLLLAEDNGTIVGTGYCQIRTSKPAFVHERHAYLGFMFVSPDYRGRGINHEILRQLMSWGKSSGVSDFYLDVYSQNTAAIKAYEKVGFEPCLVEMKLNISETF